MLSRLNYANRLLGKNKRTRNLESRARNQEPGTKNQDNEILI